MRRTVSLAFRPCIRCLSQSGEKFGQAPIIQIKDGTFYRQQPSQTPSEENPPLFPHLDFSLPSENTLDQYWAIIGPSGAGKSTLLQILQGQHLCFPPNARLYPYLSSDEIAARDTRLRYPARAIQYVGFSEKKDSLSAGMGSYLSARYESRREASDYTLADYLKGNTALNAGEDHNRELDHDLFDRVIDHWNLRSLLTFPLHHLSNGQTRRSRIAKALLAKPEVLLLDEPFLGLDPITSAQISPILGSLAKNSSPRLIISLRNQDPIPQWITHLLFLGEKLRAVHRGPAQDIIKIIRDSIKGTGPTERRERAEIGNLLTKRGVLRPVLNKTELMDNWSQKKRHSKRASMEGEPVVEIEGVKVQYEDRVVLGDWQQNVDGESKPGLWWTLRRGSRWGLFGANGSGKTTLLALITSDHPQAYSAPIKLFGRSRLPSLGQRGISIFDIQARMGHSSPEVHQLLPRRLSVRQVLESAYAETPMAMPKLTYEDDLKISCCLRLFSEDIRQVVQLKAPTNRLVGQFHMNFNIRDTEDVEWADEMLFGELSTGAQKVVLFLRATIRNPELVILDEAFSGMDERARDKCMMFLEDPMKIREIKRLVKLFALQTKLFVSPGGITRYRLTPEGPARLTFEGLKDSQTLLVISHIPEEVPSCVDQYLCLSEQGSKMPPKIGSFRGPVRNNILAWHKMWNVRSIQAKDHHGFGKPEPGSRAPVKTEPTRTTPRHIIIESRSAKLKPTSLTARQRKRVGSASGTGLVRKLDTCSVCHRTKILAYWYNESVCGSCYYRRRNPSKFISPLTVVDEVERQNPIGQLSERSRRLPKMRSDLLRRANGLLDTKANVLKSVDELLDAYSKARLAQQELDAGSDSSEPTDRRLAARSTAGPLDKHSDGEDLHRELDGESDRSEAAPTATSVRMPVKEDAKEGS